MGLFKKGFNSVREEQKRQEELRASFNSRLYNFFLTDRNDEADIVFLHGQPLTFYAHTVEEHSNGKTRWNTYVCTDDDCPYCRRDIRSSFKGAFLVYDKTLVTRENNGKKTEAEAGLRLYIAGSRVLGQLDRINTKYGLTNYIWTISRTGQGTSTQYAFDRGDAFDLDLATVKGMIPDFLADKFKPKSGSEDDIAEALLSLLESQCNLMIPNNGSSVDKSDDEDDDGEYETASAPAESKKSSAPRKLSLGKKLHKK